MNKHSEEKPKYQQEYEEKYFSFDDEEAEPEVPWDAVPWDTVNWAGLMRDYNRLRSYRLTADIAVSWIVERFEREFQRRLRRAIQAQAKNRKVKAQAEGDK